MTPDERTKIHDSLRAAASRAFSAGADGDEIAHLLIELLPGYVGRRRAHELVVSVFDNHHVLHPEIDPERTTPYEPIAFDEVRESGEDLMKVIADAREQLEMQGIVVDAEEWLREAADEERQP